MGTMRALPRDPDGSSPLVLVTWRDAHFDFELADAHDARHDYLVHTVGFLLADGPRFVSIAQEVLPQGDGYRAVTHVPHGVVERIQPLIAADAVSADPAV